MGQTIIGIDPGASGGLAWFDPEHRPVAQKFDGMTEADIAALFGFITAHGPAFAYLEQVGACGGGKEGRRQGANSMFTFGRNYGFLRGLLVGLRIPFEDVRPQKWLPAMGLRGIKDESQTEKKNRHKQKAQQLFPRLTITHKTADAILLAEYGRRQQLTQVTSKD